MKVFVVLLLPLISGSAPAPNPPPPATSQVPSVPPPDQGDPELARLEREAQRVLRQCNSPPPPTADDAKFTAEIARLRAIVQAGAVKQRKCGQKWQRAVPPKLARDYLKYLEWQDEWLGKLMERIQNFRGTCGGTSSMPSSTLTLTGAPSVGASESVYTGQTVSPAIQQRPAQSEQMGMSSLGSLRVRRSRHHHRSSRMTIQSGGPLQDTTMASGQIGGSGRGGLLIGARGGGSMSTTTTQGITSGQASGQSSGQASGLSAGAGYRSGGRGLLGRQVQTHYYGQRTVQRSNGSYGQAGGAGTGSGQASLSISGSFSRPAGGSSSSTVYRSGGSYISGGYRTGGGTQVSRGGSNISVSRGSSSSIPVSHGGSASFQSGGSSSMRTGGSYYRSGGSSAQGGSMTSGGSMTTGGSQTSMGSSTLGGGQSTGTASGGSTQAAQASSPPPP